MLVIVAVFDAEALAVRAAWEVMLLDVCIDEEVSVAVAVEYRAVNDDALALHSRQTYLGRTIDFIVELLYAYRCRIRD